MVGSGNLIVGAAVTLGWVGMRIGGDNPCPRASFSGSTSKASSSRPSDPGCLAGILGLRQVRLGWEAVGLSLERGDLAAWPGVLLKRLVG